MCVKLNKVNAVGADRCRRRRTLTGAVYDGLLIDSAWRRRQAY